MADDTGGSKPIIVQGPDGKRIQFPAGTSQDVISGALKQQYASPSPTPPTPTAPKGAPPKGPGQFASGVVEGLVGTPESAAMLFSPARSMMPAIQTGMDIVSSLSGKPKVAEVAAKLTPPGKTPMDFIEPLLSPQPTDAGGMLTRFLGGALGGLPYGGVEGGAREIPEELDATAKYLLDKGVELTPGQKAGGLAKRREDVRLSSPYVGEALRNARANSYDSFIRSVYDEALGTVGSKYDPKIPVGRAGYENVERQLTQAYDKALAGVRIPPKDGTLTADLATLSRSIKTRVKGREAEQFKAILSEEVDPWIKSGMSGPQFKNVEATLRGEANRLMSGDPNQRALADYLNDAANALRSSAERNAPAGTREALRKADTGWAIFKRIQGASSRRATSGGRFSPADLLQTIKSQDRSLGKSAFDRGDAILQRFAEKAQEKLPSEVADSGTQERLTTGLLGRILGGGLGTYLGSHLGLPGEMGGGALGVMAGEPIDRAVSRVTNALAKQRLEQAAKEALERRGPVKQAIRRVKAAAPEAAVGGAQTLRAQPAAPSQ